ncbi:MAG: hypothetical protein LWW87_01235 [Geobacteraceae bacterium]|nr:hypothetical protein [Geobacteraceae bacterium]
MSANNHTRQRERFAGPLAIAGLIGAGLLLLVVLYPEKMLLRLLENPEVSSPAQQRYLEALVRLRHGDAELVIPLVRSYLAAGCTEKAAAALRYRQGTLSGSQQNILMGLQYELRRQQLEWLIVGEPGWEAARQQYAEQIELLRKGGATAQELSRYLADARRLGDDITVRKLESFLGTHADAESAEVAAGIALGKGDYRGAAALYFKALRTASREHRRDLYLAGVRTLQSGNLVQEALVAAEQHLTGELRQDRTILKYLAKLSLAANRPDRAQIYIRQALGISGEAVRSGVKP